MKHTIKTDEYIDYINTAIAELNEFKGDAAGNLYLDDWLLSVVVDDVEERLGKVIIEDIRHEFWESCADYDKILANRHIFEVKFEKLLSWKYSNESPIETRKQYRFEIMEFFSYRDNLNVSIDPEIRKHIFASFIDLSDNISKLKGQIQDLLDQLEKMGEPFSEPIVKKSRNAKPETKNEIKPSGYRLASKKKTDFVKIISAMYEAKLFVNQEGKPLTNKQDLMNAFGTLLNDDFSSYSTLLAQAKDGDDKKYMKIFDVIKQKGWDYLNKLNEND